MEQQRKNRLKHMSKTTKELIKIIKKTSDQGTKPIDTQAEVIRVEDNTVWVHIPGGIDETPVQKTIAAKPGDNVQVRIANGDAWLVGNGSAPPTDDAKAIEAIEYSRVAAIAAEDAQISAGTAKSAAENAVTMAGRAQQAATDAERDAGIAKDSADTALTQLAYVEDVVGVLNWIAEHGDYDPTQDTEVQSGKLYFTRSGSGTSQDPYVYTLVQNPTGDPSAQGWYELTGVDEAIANYVSTHLVLLNDGLYIIKDNSGYKLKLTDYGSYIIAPDGTTVVNQNTADGNIIRATDGTVIAHLGYGEGTAQSGTAISPYYTFGIRTNNSIIGNYSHAEGNDTTASKYASHAEGYKTIASGSYSHAEGRENTASGESSHAEGYSTEANGDYSHAEGNDTTASKYASHAEGYGTKANGDYSHAEGYGAEARGDYSHAEGNLSKAIGNCSHAEGHTSKAIGNYSHAEGYGTTADGDEAHAQNLGTIAAKLSQTSLGSFNVEDTSQTTTHPSGVTSYGQYAVIVGNGTDNNSRSNALTVDWSGNVEASGGIMAVSMAGMIQMFAGSTAPTGWLLCNGSAVSRTDYAALFAVIGTTYGVGDGSTTFNLPDMRGEFPLGVSGIIATGKTS